MFLLNTVLCVLVLVVKLININLYSRVRFNFVPLYSSIHFQMGYVQQPFVNLGAVSV